MTTSIDQDADEAGLQNARVLLPSGEEVTPDSAALSHICSPAQFQADASACPASSTVGLATATSPLLAQPLEGPVVLVQSIGLPRLGVDLHGPLSLQLLGDFVITPSLGNSFQGLPDIPISHFELRFHGGSGGLIVAGRGLCDPPAPVFHADFDGWNGASQSVNPDAAVQGCGGAGGARKPKASVRLKKARSKHPRMTLHVRAGSAPVRKVRLKLPSALRFARGKAAGAHIKASDAAGALPRSAIKARRRILAVSAGVQGTTSLTARAGRGALRRTKRIAGGSRLRFPITVRDVDGRSTSLRVSARAAR